LKKPLVEGSAATPSLPTDSLLADFGEWEIMYPCFVESGLIALPEHTDD
jgi:hypothetical protein